MNNIHCKLTFSFVIHVSPLISYLQVAEDLRGGSVAERDSQDTANEDEGMNSDSRSPDSTQVPDKVYSSEHKMASEALCTGMDTGPTGAEHGEEFEESEFIEDVEEDSLSQHSEEAEHLSEEVQRRLEVPSDSEESDEETEVNRNKDFRPFRNTEAMEHVDSHNTKHERSRSSTSTSSSQIHPDLIKQKVKRQVKKQQEKQFARRVRKRGEAAVVTKQRREHQDNIKQSTSAEWY